MSDINANVVVSNPRPIFTDSRSFKAVANGRIYVGVIDTDPTLPANQIPVYLENEDGSHIQIPQPLLINGAGKIVYSGNLVKVVTVKGHSLAVYDAYGAQVDYIPNVLMYDPDQLRTQLASGSPGGGDALVAVNQPPVNGIARTQHDKNYERVSLRDFAGAVGDDWTVALQNAFNWLSSASNRTLVIPHDGVFGITSATLTLNGDLSRNARILCEGSLTHLSTTGDMITISGGMYGSFEFNITGGGYIPGSIPDYQSADPIGCQQAIVFAGNRACKLKIRAVGYPGRVLRTKSSGPVKQSFIDLDITTGNDTCGQAMYLQGTDAFGCISFANTNWDYHGSVLDGITDLSVVYWEAGSKGSGTPTVTFNNLTNCHIGTLAIGQDRTNSSLLVNNGRAITIQKALLGESTYGLEVIGSGNGQPMHQLTIHSLLCANVSTAGVRLSNAVGVTINDHVFDGCPYDVMFYNLCRDVIIKGHHRNPTTACFYGAASSTLENLVLSGKFYTAGNSMFCDLRLSDTTNVLIEDFTVVTQGYYLRLKDASNGVSVRGGNWSGTLLPITSAIEFQPRSIKDITGVATRKTNVAQSFPIGTVTGGKLSYAHGLYRSPSEMSVVVFDTADVLGATNSSIIVQNVDNVNIVFKYVGSATLANTLNFRVTLKSEDRSN
ncbi:phage head-binding domain-containing protein [Leclercia sp. UBA5958]|uniref:phage head-binding domain-containing protein n=1 Tax=Leclercia sp. UBA5958 TaxID=1946742 RepID=UPI00257EA6C4|nr:phage head-binding domain-containing protein [Leclercia sp. UBA5958]